MLSAWLHGNLRSTDLVYRRHDECFAILLPETDGPGASVVIKRILTAVRLADFRSVDVHTQFDEFREIVKSLAIPWGR